MAIIEANMGKDSVQQISDLTLRQKLARIRVEFSKSNIKKSGENKYAGFKYFELCDIVPRALELFEKYDVTLDFNMSDESVTGTLYDNLKDVSPIVFSFPKKGIDDPKAMRMNAVQAMGSEITYYRRYLYNVVLDIVENDSIDCQDNTQKNSKKAQKTSPNTVKTELINNNTLASKERVNVLIKAIKELLDKKPEYTEKMKAIAEKTNRYTSMTEDECEELLLQVKANSY